MLFIDHKPIEMREFKKKTDLLNIESLGYFGDGSLESNNKLLKLISAIELGRIVTRDIGGGDPERMTPQRVHEYVNEAFKSSDSIKITSIEGQEVFEKEYPLFAAVNRAADGNDWSVRHFQLKMLDPKRFWSV